ncbi:MAG: Trm112 family protein [Proteobacteria bacterium]|nr:Trm112 family protein [Pseudomonadota bacterium]
MLKKELLEILACPQCKGPVELTVGEDFIVCRACKLLYAIRDNIPIMLLDEAKPLTENNP